MKGGEEVGAVLRVHPSPISKDEKEKRRATEGWLKKPNEGNFSTQNLIVSHKRKNSKNHKLKKDRTKKPLSLYGWVVRFVERYCFCFQLNASLLINLAILLSSLGRLCGNLISFTGMKYQMEFYGTALEKQL